eukprot:TRINITY_DN79958_c0_g1_i1.p1 TRINITY_DN79958_c0_g1~~TRINITY_DN79958_c0_g1_i1.p1  ORF type:complete len:150 (-),score=25.85 TRINITY_DN79958_c0_g1_i1:22-471(-)
MPNVRFCVTGVPADLNEAELQHALVEQLGLDDIVLHRDSLKEDPAGDNESMRAEFELPDEEADLLRGPYQEAKVYVRRTIRLQFAEVPKHMPKQPKQADDLPDDLTSLDTPTTALWSCGDSSSGSVSSVMPSLIGKPQDLASVTFHRRI